MVCSTKKLRESRTFYGVLMVMASQGNEVVGLSLKYVRSFPEFLVYFLMATHFFLKLLAEKKIMKRYDPQMHTAEHILNQTMIRMFGCDRSFSSHLERKKSKCDYLFDRPLTDEEEQLIQEKVNRVINLGLPVTEKHVDISRAAHLYDTSKLPEQDLQSLRIVNVGDYDSCPCIGEHVSNSAEIGEFRLTTSSFENGVLRIRFKLARRASKHI